ncbi:MAG: WecB/TagA/CpsF family glycosyltransferase [Phycisphaeraceae bacterium]|nr:WecB/TagA/CpsF family glycosyltransferase [Phycisphaeraceae bacterium]
MSQIQTSQLPTIKLMGVTLQAITQKQCVDHILDQLQAGHGGWVITPNLDHLRRLVRDAKTRELYDGADLMVADGMPLIWASRLQGTPLPERVAGSDLTSSLPAEAAKRGLSVFLLGGADGAAKKAADVLLTRHPNLNLAGIHVPAFGFENDSSQMAALENALLDAKPDIVLVALGSPKQEVLIKQLRDKLPGAWWLGIGISFSFVCGDVQRAPRWIQRFGLEWVHRLLQEPRRLARRYLIDGIPFGIALLTGAIWSRLGRTSV